MNSISDDLTSRRIGLLDCRLDNFHADVFLKEIRAVENDRRYRVAGAFGLEAGPSAAWAEKNGVPYYEDASTLCKAVDCLMILAPSNPEAHLPLCETAFPFGKTTYVDKTFAPDEATAKAIFALADRHGVAVQTTSAMRYTAVQQALARGSGCRNLTVWGGGTSFEEYGIHAVELAISCLGAGATSMVTLGNAARPVIVLSYEGGVTATIHFNAEDHTPFRAAIATDGATECVGVDGKTLFADANGALLDFFDAGEAQIDRQESLLIRRILDLMASRPVAGELIRLDAGDQPRADPRPLGLGRLERRPVDA